MVFRKGGFFIAIGVLGIAGSLGHTAYRKDNADAVPKYKRIYLLDIVDPLIGLLSGLAAGYGTSVSERDKEKPDL